MVQDTREVIETRVNCITEECARYLFGGCGFKRVEIENGTCSQFAKKEKSNRSTQ